MACLLPTAPFHSREQNLEVSFFFLFRPCWVPTAVCGLSLVAASRGCSLVAVPELRDAVTSLVVEHQL